VTVFSTVIKELDCGVLNGFRISCYVSIGCIPYVTQDQWSFFFKTFTRAYFPYHKNLALAFGTVFMKIEKAFVWSPMVNMRGVPARLYGD
jgi:hypothetical protein